jgi:hypothetical protein
MLSLTLVFAQVVSATPAVQPPRIDGRLDEQLWQGEPIISELRQRAPQEGAPATDDTKVWVSYDRDHLYIAFEVIQASPVRAYYLEPDFSRGDDTIAVLIDPWKDRRNGFLFEINANGARKDVLTTDNGSSRNSAWNGVWWAETQRNLKGWTAELRIPFATLNFPLAEVHSWGFNVQRRISKGRQEAVWQGWQRRFDFADPAVAGTLEGLRSIRSGQRVQLRPYAMGGFSKVTEDGVVEQIALKGVGLDVDALISPPVKLSVTINPDFAQVEADQAQLNLSHHSLYLPEKRLFFIEGKDFFSFGTSSSNQPFYSRRIGLDEEDEPQAILGGIRLLGRAGKTRIGLLSAQVSEEAWSLDKTHNASVIRVKQNLFKQSSIGGLGTVLTQGSDVQGVAGLDLRLRSTQFLGKNTIEAEAAGAVGWSNDEGQKGETWRLGLDWPNKNWDAGLMWERISADYEPALGFTALTGVDRLRLDTHYTHHYKNLKHPLRNIQFSPFTGYIELDEETAAWSHYRVDVVPIEGVSRGGRWAKLNLFAKGFVLDEPWEILEGYTAAVGEYQDVGIQAMFANGWQRQLGLYTYIEEAQYFGGRRTSGRLWVQWKASPNFRVSSSNGLYWMRNDDSSALGRDHNLRLRSSLNRAWHGSLLGQWNSASENTLVNLRLRYIPRPGADAYLVLNQAWDKSWTPIGTSIQAKLVWQYGL